MSELPTIFTNHRLDIPFDRHTDDIADCSYCIAVIDSLATKQAIWELQRAYEYHPDYLHDMLIKRLKELTALLPEQAKQ